MSSLQLRTACLRDTHSIAYQVVLRARHLGTVIMLYTLLKIAVIVFVLSGWSGVLHAVAMPRQPEVLPRPAACLSPAAACSAAANGRSSFI